MADISETYGSGYHHEAQNSRVNHALKAIATNVANKNFDMRFDSSDIWRQNYIKPEASKQLVQKIEEINPDFAVSVLNKNSDDINMLPYTLAGSVEYLRIIDIKNRKMYFMYITPENMEPF